MERIKGYTCADGIFSEPHQNGTGVYVEEIPANAIHSKGISTTGFNLLLSQDFSAIEERQMYEIILIPIVGFPKPPKAG